MSTNDLKLIAHLRRRAGFGATRQELKEFVSKGYEGVVEDLLHPGDPQNLPDDLIRRYHPDHSELRFLYSAAGYWLYRMITTSNPLEEKLTLFWHGLFATGYAKLNQARSLLNQIDMFRVNGLGNFSDILLQLSRDPAMLLWLDNNDNHKGAINENFGRELLELFSMGIGNYSEQDIKEASRAFTGWTLGNVDYMAMRASKDSIWPYGRIAWHFEYRSDDHDDGEKTFLGETGNFNGEQIIDLIAKDEATARFVSTRLFQFFAADMVGEKEQETIESMMKSYFDSNYEIRSVLRTLFNSPYFKSEEARYSRVKGPVEQIVGAIHLAGSYSTPTIGIEEVAQQAFYMGQGLLEPPTVEGWHEGEEWIDSGALVERTNFASSEVGNLDSPGVRAMIQNIGANNGGSMSPETVVEKCLDMLGAFDVSEKTLSALVGHVARSGNIDLNDTDQFENSKNRLAEVFRLITASPDFQRA